MNTAIEAKSSSVNASKKRSRGKPRPPWMEAILSDWRKRWPAAFAKPVPLAVGISGHMKTALRAEGMPTDRKMFGYPLHMWTMQSAYLHAVMRGEMRRNLDGSEAGVPTDEARQEAKKVLDERSARRARRDPQAREK